jgi:putative transposase
MLQERYRRAAGSVSRLRLHFVRCPKYRRPVPGGEVDSTLAPQPVVAQCTGYTSRVLRERFPGLKRRLPSLWSRAYYVGSAGSVSATAIRHYVEQQNGV